MLNPLVAKMPEMRDKTPGSFWTLDRAIHWNTFLFSVNLLWEDIIKSVYGNGIDMDSNTRHHRPEQDF
jgi:hypothetical protein